MSELKENDQTVDAQTAADSEAEIREVPTSSQLSDEELKTLTKIAVFMPVFRAEDMEITDVENAPVVIEFVGDDGVKYIPAYTSPSLAHQANGEDCELVPVPMQSLLVAAHLPALFVNYGTEKAFKVLPEDRPRILALADPVQSTLADFPQVPKGIDFTDGMVDALKAYFASQSAIDSAVLICDSNSSEEKPRIILGIKTRDNILRYKRDAAGILRRHTPKNVRIEIREFIEDSDDIDQSVMYLTPLLYKKSWFARLKSWFTKN